METVKVDVRKLQLLNDRINQTLEALHQVRLTMHAPQQIHDERNAFSFAPGGVPQGYGYGYGFGVPQYIPQQGVPFSSLPYMGAPMLPPWLQAQQSNWSRPQFATNGYNYNGYDTEASARFTDPRFTQSVPFGFAPQPIPAFG